MLSEKGEIALSLSGGGVRAMGYHLGTMDYLNRLGWLERVTILSSVSGGSMTAIGYALAKKKQLSFEDFYGQIFECLPPLNTVEMIFEDLIAKKPVAPSGRRDLITCWADVYRQFFYGPYYGDPDFDIFWSGPQTHLREVIFNAVELKSGVAFRFQYSENTENFRIGNGNIWLEHDHARQMKVSDVMASSCAIPGGMEPLQMPRDYRWPGDQWDRKGPISRPVCDAVEKHLEQRFGEDAANIAIVDGGIYDNQTISSVLLALRRAHGHTASDDPQDSAANEELEEKEPAASDEAYRTWAEDVLEDYKSTADQDRLGMYIISDAVVRHDPMYKPDPDNCIPTRDRSWLRRRTLSQVHNFGTLVIVALLISACMNLYDFASAGGFTRTGNIYSLVFNVISTLIPGLVAAVIATLIVMARRKIERATTTTLSHIPPLKRSFWSLVKGLTVGNILDMLSVRAESLSALVSRFFMHRTRQLEYSIVFQDKRLANKVLPNEIYRLLDPPKGLTVSADLASVVGIGANLPTKIWVNDVGTEPGDPAILHGRNDLQVLVATGQATIIANLLRHADADQTELLATLEADWRRINDDPFHFVDNRP